MGRECVSRPSLSIYYFFLAFYLYICPFASSSSCVSFLTSFRFYFLSFLDRFLSLSSHFFPRFSTFFFSFLIPFFRFSFPSISPSSITHPPLYSLATLPSPSLLFNLPPISFSTLLFPPSPPLLFLFPLYSSSSLSTLPLPSVLLCSQAQVTATKVKGRVTAKDKETS